jgi:hypothetical protein
MKRIVVLLAISLPATALADRSYNQERDISHDCAKESKVSINVSATTAVFTGTCDAISINGATNKVTIAAAKKVSVTGASNNVDIGAADAISATGISNVITYKKALTQKVPKIASPGINNSITKVADTASTDKPADKPAEKPADKPADKPAESKPAPPAGNLVTRKRYDDSDITGTHDCAKEPDVTINGSTSRLTFVGACTDINVNGGDNTLVVESTKDIDVNGADNTVDIAAVDSISVNGAENKVTYKKGIKGAKPRVKNRGLDNKISQVK